MTSGCDHDVALANNGTATFLLLKMGKYKY